jgi:signal transduction histidine kinase/CheY-like chemotaxis protein
VNKGDKFIKAKVILGYVLCLMALLLSLYFIQRDYKHLTTADKYENEVIMRRRAVNRTLSLLYQSETLWQSFLLGRASYNGHYQYLMDDLMISLQDLRHYSKSPSQLNRINNVSALLLKKQESTDHFIKIVKELQANSVNYDQILRHHYKVVHQKNVSHKVTIQRDSVVEKSHTKKFFKRLAEVFVPSKEAKKVIKESRVIQSDTVLRPYDPTSNVSSIVRDIQVNVSNKRSGDRDKINAILSALKTEDNVLMNKVNQILSDFEREDERGGAMIIADQARIKASSIKTLIVITTLSTVLFFVLLIIILKDLSRSKRYRRELEDARSYAERLMQTREKLMLTVTHDFKAPLGSIMGYIDLLLRITADKRSYEYLKNMKSSSDHLLQLVSDLLDFHRLDAHKMEINDISFNLLELFHEIEMSFLPQAERKGLQWSVIMDPALDQLFSGDPLRIRQIVNNLVSNALKFTSKGGVTVFAQYKDNQLQIKVVDTGCGVSRQDQDRIFEEFTRLSNAQGEEGFGLGLSITKKLVYLLNGHISVQSKEAGGSSFVVEIPVSRVENKGQTHDLVYHPNLNILLIDDDRIQMELTIEMLRNKGISVIGCLHYDEILDKIRSQPFDLLLTDLQMPTMNGIDLLHKLRNSEIEQAKSIPVIVVTARSEMSHSELKAIGFSDCLHKPFTINELLEVISHNFSGLDVDGLTSLSSDKETVIAIRETFIEETTKNKDSFQIALNQKDVKMLAFLSHKMLPVFTLMKAQSCLDEMKWLEENNFQPFDQQTERKACHVLEVMGQSILEVKQKLS